VAAKTRLRAHSVAHLPEFHAAAGSEPHARSAAILLKGFNRSTVKPMPRPDSAVAVDSFCGAMAGGTVAGSQNYAAVIFAAAVRCHLLTVDGRRGTDGGVPETVKPGSRGRERQA
jgi:hypothetical protein